MNRVCIFIPAYNCEKTITKVIDGMSSEVKKKYTILIVDDGSFDNTSDVVKDYIEKKKMKNVVLIRNNKNLGYGGVQKIAYNYALSEGYDVVFMVHGDKQHPSDMIEDVIKRLGDNYALVYGSRMLGNPKKGGMPLYKIFGSKSLTFIENIFLGTKISEFHSGFRAYNCSYLKQVKYNSLTDLYFFDTEILIQMIDKNFKIGEIPIPTYYGPNASGIPFLEAVKYSLGILKTLIEYKMHKYGIKKSKKYSS